MNFLHSKYYGLKSFIYSRLSIYLPFLSIYGFGLKMLDIYSSTVLFIEEETKKIYDNNSIVRSGVDFLISYKDFVSEILFDIKKHPNEEYWNNFIHITNKNQFKYFESYEILDKELLKTHDDKVSCLTNSSSFLKNAENKNHVCLVTKLNDLYVVQIDNVDFQTDFLQKSNIEIISATYSHPQMDKKITLSIPKTMVLCNNNLFNAAFILYCLHYQNESYIFDENYQVDLIDGEVNTYELHYNDFLVVKKNELTINKVHNNNE